VVVLGGRMFLMSEVPRTLTIRPNRPISDFKFIFHPDGGVLSRTPLNPQPSKPLRGRGFRIRDSGFKFKVSGFGIRISSFGFRDSDSGIRESGAPGRAQTCALPAPVAMPAPPRSSSAHRVPGFGFRFQISDFGSGVSDMGFWV